MQLAQNWRTKQSHSSSYRLPDLFLLMSIYLSIYLFTDSLFSGDTYLSIYWQVIYLPINNISISESISLTCCLWGQLSPLALVIVINQEGCCSRLFAFNFPHLCIKMHKSLFQVYNFFIAGKHFNRLYRRRLGNDVQLTTNN